MEREYMAALTNSIPVDAPLQNTSGPLNMLAAGEAPSHNLVLSCFNEKHTSEVCCLKIQPIHLLRSGCHFQINSALFIVSECAKLQHLLVYRGSGGC